MQRSAACNAIEDILQSLHLIRQASRQCTAGDLHPLDPAQHLLIISVLDFCPRLLLGVSRLVEPLVAANLNLPAQSDSVEHLPPLSSGLCSTVEEQVRGVSNDVLCVLGDPGETRP